MASIEKFGRFAREVGGETRHMVHHLGYRARQRKARLAETANRVLHPELKDQETFEKLLELGIAPEGFFHNSASADYFPVEKRFQRALQDPLISGLEVDILYYPWGLYAGHGHGFLFNHKIRNRILFKEAKLSSVMDKAGDKFERFNFDLKISQKETLEEFLPYLDGVPENARIFISGKNWYTLYSLMEAYQNRPLTLLFTVDNEHRRNTRGNFVEMAKSLSPGKHSIGVSLKNEDEITTPGFMRFLKENNYYSLLYSVDTHHDLIEAAKKGASGVTSNKPRILHITELARQTLSKAA